MSHVQQSAVIEDTWTVNQTVSAHPDTLAVFNRFGIDTCCGGAATIEVAAKRHNVDAVTLMHALRLAEAHE